MKNWTQDDFDALLEIVDALALTIKDVASINDMTCGSHELIQRRACSIHERARAMYQRKTKEEHDHGSG